MSIKRYALPAGNRGLKNNNKFSFSTYNASRFPKLEKPKHFSLECEGDIHAITLMPNGSVHFHNHKNIQEMVHLVTFDMLKEPNYDKCKLFTCLKLLRGLRTRRKLNTGYPNRSTQSDYWLNELLDISQAPITSRAEFNSQHTPIPWRQEILSRYTREIRDKLSKDLKYYGMNNEGYYDFSMNFSFCLTSHFMPSASMSFNDKERRKNSLILNIMVSPQWLINVWLKNKAVVNDTLILNIVKEYPNGTTLCLAAKQSHGFKIKSTLAIVDFDKKVLSWVNDAERKSDYLDKDKMPRRRRTKKEMKEATDAISLNPNVPIPEGV